jgi:hypothetical protein
LPAVVARPCGSVARSSERRSAPDRRAPPGGIDPDLAHRRQVDHQTGLRDALAKHAVTPALDADLQAPLATISNRSGDVGGRGASGDQRGSPVDGRIPDFAVLVICGIVGAVDIAGETGDRGGADHHGLLQGTRPLPTTIPGARPTVLR